MKKYFIFLFFSLLISTTFISYNHFELGLIITVPYELFKERQMDKKRYAILLFDAHSTIYCNSLNALLQTGGKPLQIYDIGEGQCLKIHSYYKNQAEQQQEEVISWIKQMRAKGYTVCSITEDRLSCFNDHTNYTFPEIPGVLPDIDNDNILHYSPLSLLCKKFEKEGILTCNAEYRCSTAMHPAVYEQETQKKIKETIAPELLAQCAKPYKDERDGYIDANIIKKIKEHSESDIYVIAAGGYHLENIINIFSSYPSYNHKIVTISGQYSNEPTCNSFTQKLRRLDNADYSPSLINLRKQLTYGFHRFKHISPNTYCEIQIPSEKVIKPVKEKRFFAIKTLYRHLKHKIKQRFFS